jgi:peptide/nickel transport system permease protein
MSAYIIRRLFQGVVILVIVSVMVFLMMRLLPGDPLLLYITENDIEVLSEEQLQELRVEFGLDKSMPLQYFDWMGGIFHGDFGKSIVYNDRVGTLLLERFPVTAHLGILSVIFSSVFGILLGLVSALRRGKGVDTLATSIANFGISVPNFWLGVLLIYFFGLYTDLLPIHGYTSPFEDFWLSTQQLIMPVFCLSVLPLASEARQTRSSMLEVIRHDYVRTAWSKGLSERYVVIRHVLKNGLIPVITLIGLQVSHIFGGSVLIETVFNIPGVGRLLVDAVFAQDYPVVQGVGFIMAMIVVLTNIVVDISYGWLDPRIRYG